MDVNFLFPKNSSVGSLLREYDWSQSSLNSPDTWSSSLKTIVRLILDSKFPMFVAWGPELGFLYNDAYAQILGNKHPAALGNRFQDIWKEIWADIIPIVDAALAGQSSYHEDLPLTIERGGYAEQAWFTFSYSPVHDNEGRIIGLYCAAVETTKIVRNHKLRQFQLDLADKLHCSSSPQMIIGSAVETLSEQLNAEVGWYAMIDDISSTFHSTEGWLAKTHSERFSSGKIDEFHPAFRLLLSDGAEFISNDLTTDSRTCIYADQYRAANIAATMVMPIIDNNQLIFAISVTKPNVYIWTTEEIQAAKDVLNRTWIAIANNVTQQHLQTERNSSDHILNQMDEGFLLVDADECIRKINTKGLEMLQRTAAEVVGYSHTGLWPDTLTKSKIARAFKSVRKSAKATTLELHFRTFALIECWWEMRVSILDDEGLMVFFRDVTQQKHAALTLRRSEAHMTSLFEQTSAGITERDRCGRLTRANERFCQILGRSREELLQTSILDVTHVEDRMKSEAAFEKLLLDHQPFEIEKRYVKPDGTLVWVSVTASLTRREGDQSTESVLAVVLDITERKHAEEALQAETRILELLNASWQSLASTLDLKTLLQTVTDNGRELIGAKFGAFFYNGKNEHGDAMTLYTLSGASRDAFDSFGHPRPTAVFKDTFVGRPPVRSDDITKDSRYGHMSPHYGMPKGHPPVKSYLAASVISHSGDVIGGLFFGHPEAGVFTERSERLITGLAAQAALSIDNARLYDQAQKAADERQLLLSSERAARAESERLNRLKDEFLAMLAHELRNPLAPVSAAAEILRLNHSDSTRVSQASEIISRQITHFTRLIDDLMDVSRVTRGLIHLDLEPLNINEIISTAIEQVKPMIDARHHHLITEIKTEHNLIRGDRTRLVQTIANLLTNAAKYTPLHGEIVLNVEIFNERVNIVISDNGNGIDAELLPHVFDLFTQGARGLDRTQGGLGIGLALVKAIVTLHHGEIQVHSNGLGLGSTFTVSIPFFKHDLLHHNKPTAPPIQPAYLSILLVDDNIDAANALSILLTTLGYRVLVAATAVDAIGIAEIEPIDVFILDIGLPDMTGYELAKTLQRQHELKQKTYFALTGYSQPQDRELSKEAGFKHHFVKPVTSQQLLKALDEIKPSSVGII